MPYLFKPGERALTIPFTREYVLGSFSQDKYYFGEKKNT